ncbi:MAG: glutathione S-transferase [Wenzhouxiangellaceae bacterium]
MIIVHHLEQSRSRRVVWMLEELGVEYRVRRYKRDPETRLAPPELKKVHPLGKAPVIRDGDHTLAESAVILEYLARRYGDGQWAPEPDAPNYWAFQYWMHYAEGSLMPPLLLKLVISTLRQPPVPFLVRPITARAADEIDRRFTDRQIELHFSHVNAHLEKQAWFAGDRISAADIQMSFPLEAALEAGTVSAEDYPAVAAWIERIQARPAWQRAAKRAGR